MENHIQSAREIIVKHLTQQEHLVHDVLEQVIEYDVANASGVIFGMLVDIVLRETIYDLISKAGIRGAIFELHDEPQMQPILQALYFYENSEFKIHYDLSTGEITCDKSVTNGDGQTAVTIDCPVLGEGDIETEECMPFADADSLEEALLELAEEEDADSDASDLRYAFASKWDIEPGDAGYSYSDKYTEHWTSNLTKELFEAIISKAEEAHTC